MAERELTDREQLLAWQQAEKAEAQTVDRMFHYEALGVGLAVFCQVMFDTLTVAEEDTIVRFSRDEALALVQAAVRGR